jgi:hypothetical protein
MGKVVAPFKGEAHFGGQHHGPASSVKTVIRHAITQFKFQFQLPVGALELDGLSGVGLHAKSKSQAKEDKGEFFHVDTFIDDGGKDRKIFVFLKPDFYLIL